MKDLGVWLDEKLTYKKHLDITIAKAWSTLSIIKRFKKEFENVYTIKTDLSSNFFPFWLKTLI